MMLLAVYKKLYKGVNRMFKTEFAFYCYLAAAVSTIVWGVIYLVWPHFLPYHRKAVGLPWQEVPSGFKILILALFKVSAGPVIASGIAMIILLAIPFRNGEQWALWAIPLISLITNLPVFWGTMKMLFQTEAVSPWLQIVFALVATILGYFLAHPSIGMPQFISNQTMLIVTIVMFIVFFIIHIYAIRIYDKLNK
jgi:hypothetical protein